MSSEESYDPEDEKKRKDDKNRKRLNRKIIRKRKRGGPAARARDVALKQQRRNRGEINRSDEYQHRTLQRRAGDVEHTEKSKKRQCGDINRSDEYQHMSLQRRKRARAIDSDPSDSIWTSCALPTDEQLKSFHKDPYNAVAAFRLMTGIPADPRICSANLEFQVDEENIISRFSKFCGHGATIKICGACGIGDIMINDESYKLPLSHTRIFFLLCDKDFLRSISDLRRQSMHLLEIDEQTYHLDPAGFDDIDKTINICATCYASLAHA